MNIRYYEKRPGAWHMDFRGPEGQRCRPYAGETEAQARANAPRILGMAFAGPPAPAAAPKGAPAGPTLLEAYRKALRVREQWLTSKNKGSLQTTFDNLGLADETPMASLTRDLVRDLRTKWMAEPGKRKGSTLAPATINHRLSMLSVLLEVCDLPGHGVKHLSVRGNRRTRRISDAEYDGMLDWCAANAHRRGALGMGKLIQLAWHTAARQGELLGLTWSDIGETSMALRDTKNSDTRHIPLNPPAKAALESRRALPAPFADLDSDRCKALWQDMRFSMGLATDEEFVFHTIRHEWASRAVDRNENPFVIQAVMGHSNITTTQVYVKAGLDAMSRALNAPATATAAQ